MHADFIYTLMFARLKTFDHLDRKFARFLLNSPSNNIYEFCLIVAHYLIEIDAKIFTSQLKNNVI